MKGIKSYCSVAGHRITALRTDPVVTLSDTWETSKGFLDGIDENGFPFSVLLPSNLISDKFFDLPISKKTKLFSPLIIRHNSNTNIYGGIGKYDAISCIGGIMNKVYNPKINALMGLDESDFDMDVGSRTIQVRPFDDFTREINAMHT